MANSTAKPAAETNIKDTIESILVAFIFAFVFRAFVVEAFVIPTGSMAPTLMGAHTSYVCPDCGYPFTVNYPTPDDDKSLTVPNIAEYTNASGQTVPKVQAIFCPNCGYRLPRANPADPAHDATAAPVNYGDRILVMKYSYLLNSPKRWDVIVFRSPDTRTRDYTINYIKRLAGLPGESLMVLNGDLYVAKVPPGTEPKPGDFKIQQKPRAAQEALWRIVYDADYVPKSAGSTRPLTNPLGQVDGYDAPWQQPWQQKAGTGWVNNAAGVDARTFHFDNSAGSGTLAFDSAANPNKHGMTDWLAYNVTFPQIRYGPWASDTYSFPSYPSRRSGQFRVYNVSDLKLDFFYQHHSGTGPLKLEMTKDATVFTAELTPGGAALFMQPPAGGRTQIGTTRPIDLTGGPHRVTLQNVDYHVELLIDSKVLLQSGDEYQPDVADLIRRVNDGQDLPPGRVRIVAADQSCDITHVSLWRDDYYTEQVSEQSIYRASPIDFPSRIATLGPDEYFALGDNSPISGDARVWSSPVNQPNESLTAPAGVVPERFLLGKAFFVYWPAGYRFTGDSPPALVPNFGKMRFVQ